MWRFVLCSLWCVGPAIKGAAAERVIIGGITVDIWKPQGTTPPTGFPMVVFSHGYLACGTQSTLLMGALAQAGYFVLAPNHRDALCGAARAIGWLFPEQSFFRSDQWSDETYQDRVADIRAILNAQPAIGWFEGVPVDRNRVALAGHSLGGYTVLGMAGGWPSWKDKRVKAVLAFAPFSSPFVGKGDLGHLNVPVMYQSGTLDLGGTAISGPGQAYSLSGAPKIYVEFNGATHLAWTDLSRTYLGVIAEYSIAFLDQYLKGTDRLTTLTAKPLPAQVRVVQLRVK